MRRLKAIYLVPVFLVLMIGGAAAAYYFLFKPQLEKVKVARGAWETARATCMQEENGYQKALDDRAIAAKTIFDGYHTFSQIKDRMPNIVSMKDLPGYDDKQKLVMYYKIWATGAVVKELNRWARSFHLPSTPEFSFAEATLGYEESLPSVKIISVPMGSQKYRVRGLPNLLNAIRRTTGVGYFPLIIQLDGGAAQIDVIRNDPKSPGLEMSYSATAYFFTRGWDPMGPTAKSDVKALEPIITTKLTAEPHRNSWTNGECPKVLWYFEQKGLEF